MRVKKNIMINNAGGTASKNGKMYRISLPADMVRGLGVRQDNRSVLLEDRDGGIFISKNSEYEPKEYDSLQVGITSSFIQKVGRYIRNNSDENKMYLCPSPVEHEYDVFGAELNGEYDIYSLTVSETENPLYFDSYFYQSGRISNSSSIYNSYLSKNGMDGYEDDDEFDVDEYIVPSVKKELDLLAEYGIYKEIAVTILQFISTKYKSEHDSIKIFTKEGDLLVQYPVQIQEKDNAYEKDCALLVRNIEILNARLGIAKNCAIDFYSAMSPERLVSSISKDMYLLGKLYIIQCELHNYNVDNFTLKNGNRIVHESKRYISWSYDIEDFDERTDF